MMMNSCVALLWEGIGLRPVDLWCTSHQSLLTTYHPNECLFKLQIKTLDSYVEYYAEYVQS